MSRARSKTADSTEVRRVKGSGLPRRLNEKIALMKEKEQVQSEAFEQAMKSIFEMQQARVHSGGGSMPSLQAIDNPSTYPHTLPNQHLQMGGDCLTVPSPQLKERPLSRSSSGRRMTLERTQSCETESYLQRPTPHTPYWNVHKSDSDLQQSLLTEQQQQTVSYQPSMMIHPSYPYPPSQHSPHSPSHHSYLTVTHSFPPYLQDGDKNLWNNMSMSPVSGGGRPVTITAGMMSNMEQYASAQSPSDGSFTPLAVQGGASSLPDLTNTEFSSGLDVPIERDDDSPTLTKFHPIGGYGMPKPAFPSMQVGSPGAASASTFIANHPFLSPPHMANSHSHLLPGQHTHQPHFQTPLFLLPQPVLGVRAEMGGTPPWVSGIQKSPTMPNICTQLSAPPVRKFKPIVPAMPTNNTSPPHVGLKMIGQTFGQQQQPVSLGHGGPFVHSGVAGMRDPASPRVFSLHLPHSATPTSPSVTSPPAITGAPISSLPGYVHHRHLHHSPNVTMATSTNAPPLQPGSNSQPSSNIPAVTIDSSNILLGNTPAVCVSSPHKPSGLASTASSGYISLPPYPDSMYQQRMALQQRLAGISFVKPDPPCRSHSEENLFKIQKEKGEVMQQNPFMGNMSNASSVPCVYVEPQGVDPCVDQCDSPTTGTGSPSTSASYASSPPSIRPTWMEHPHFVNDFVFQDWPPEGQLDKPKFGSPLAHHKSLTELNKLADVMMDCSPSSQNKTHMLSLPSIVMSDLAVDEQLEKQESNSFLPGDFEMDDDTIQSLLQEESFMPYSDMLASEQSSDFFQHHQLNF